MNTRLALTALVLFLALCGCSEDKTTGPGTQSRVGASFDEFAVGTFTTAASGDYTFTYDESGSNVDHALVVDIGSGNKALKDADNTNETTTLVAITSTNQRLFSFDSLDVSDLLGTEANNALSRVAIRGYHATTLVGTDFISPSSPALDTEIASNLAGVPVSRVDLEIRSAGGTTGDDLCVSYVDLTALSAALLDFDALPLGEIEFLNVGEFRMTWTGLNDHQVLIDQADGNYALSDGDRENTDAAAVTIVLSDGGVFQYDAVYAADLLGQGPSETNSESKIVISGFNGTTLVGTETLLPTDDETVRFDVGALDGLNITSLVVSIASYNGTFISDDLVIEGLLVTIVE
jgi:hypothetical protein